MFCAAKNAVKQLGAAIPTKRLSLVVAALGLLLWAAPVHAVGGDTSVNVYIHDKLPAVLTIGSAAANPATTVNEVMLTGVVHNVSQIMVYINNVYVKTVALDLGASQYNVGVPVTPGEHTIKLVALDPFTASQLEQTVTFTYTPPDPGTPVAPVPATPATSTPVIGASTPVTGPGIVIQAFNGAKQQINAGSSAGPMKDLTDFVFYLLVDLGVISTKSMEQTRATVARMSLISIGAVLLLLPRAWYMWGLGRVKTWLSLKFAMAGAPGVLRVVGAILFVLPFMLFTV